MHRTPKTESLSSPDHETIRTLAYCLWEDAGRPPGQDVFFWTTAESRLAVPKAPVAKATKSAGSATPKRSAAAAPNGKARRQPKPRAGKAAR